MSISRQAAATAYWGKRLILDDANRLCTATVNGLTTTYRYNALGQRVLKTNTNETVLYLYDLNGQLLAEADSSGVIQKEYAYMNGEPLAQIDVLQNLIYYYHTDHLGTPQSMTDPLQQVVWKANYTPFGKADITVDDVVNNLRFPGQYFDDETNLHYNHWRYYDPTTGRYITSDPIGLEAGLNTYAYVGGMPTRYVDPTGLEAVPVPVPGLPLIIPPVAIPGTPENDAWRDMVNDLMDAMGNIELGPWPGSTTRDDPESAGTEAADDIRDKESDCPPDPNDPNRCKEVAQKCKQKCIGKVLEGIGRMPMSEWIQRCNNSCTSSLGCGSYFP